MVVGEVRSKCDLPRVLVRGQAASHEGLDLRRELVRQPVPLFENHEGLDDLRPDRVGLADRGRERHSRVADQAVLDLAGADAISRGGDDVVVAADEMDVAVLDLPWSPVVIQWPMNLAWMAPSLFQ